MPHITLIYPTLGRDDKGKYKHKKCLPPIGLANIAGLTPKRFDITFYDDRLENIPFDEPTDLVGISVDTFTAKRSYEIADDFKKRNVPVVLGGFHPTLLPEESIQYADAIVVGQAENSWKKLINNFEHNSLQKFYYSEPKTQDIYVDMSIFKKHNYLPFSQVETGRGCVFSCDFCSVQNFFGKRHYARPLEKIVEQIQNEGKKKVLFIDDNIASNHKHLGLVAEAVKPLGINWASQMSLTVCKDEYLMDAIADSGCKAVLIGFESLDERNLKQMRKLFNEGEENYISAIKKFHERGIHVYGTFAVGYDWETLESIDKMLEFALENKLSLASFYPLTPFPGTGWYKTLKDEKRLFNEKWWLNSQHKWVDVVFQPKNMSAEDLTKKCHEIMDEFYTWKNILKRSFSRTISNKSFLESSLIFGINHITYKEVKNKRDIYLGVKD